MGVGLEDVDPAVTIIQTDLNDPQDQFIELVSVPESHTHSIIPANSSALVVP